MLATDLLKEATIAINANRARSALTILGIVIGIGSVIAMISIGQGASSSITESIESGGTNLLNINPGTSKGFGSAQSAQGTAKSLTYSDAESLNGIEHIEAVSPETSSRYQIIYKNNNINSSVVGIEPSYRDVNDIDMNTGAFISNANINSFSKVTVLGANAATDLFGERADPVGQSIRINNLNFKVIGIMEEIGAGFNSPDDEFMIPISTAQRYFIGDDSLSSIVVKVDDAKNMTTAEEEVTAVLLENHNIKSEENADFSVRNMAEMLEMASSVTGALTILLGSIAGISLVVGGIGIMNMMLTSVTERTKEIGLRKAIGAKARDINMQFLSESVILTFIGGIIGVVFGWGISYLVARFMDTATSVTWFSVILAFGVSVAIGIIFGYYPARRAAKLNPIEALRYE